MGHSKVGPTYCKNEAGLQGKATAPEKAAFVGCSAAGATDLAGPILKRWLLPSDPHIFENKDIILSTGQNISQQSSGIAMKRMTYIKL